MKKIGLTQRVDIGNPYCERRDALDQRWVDYLLSLKLYPVLIPNNAEFAEIITKEGSLEGVIFTGGNSMSICGGDAPERDSVELTMLKWAIESNIPILGVCRGMQLIQNYFHNPLTGIEGHIATYHSLNVNADCRLAPLVSNLNEVNSFHDFGAMDVFGELVLVAKSEDGVVMAVEHSSDPIYGVMWHSERESPYNKIEQEIFKFVFGVEN